MEATLAESARILLTFPFGSFLSCSKNFSSLLSSFTSPDGVTFKLLDWLNIQYSSPNRSTTVYEKRDDAFLYDKNGVYQYWQPNYQPRSEEVRGEERRGLLIRFSTYRDTLQVITSQEKEKQSNAHQSGLCYSRAGRQDPLQHRELGGVMSGGQGSPEEQQSLHLLSCWVESPVVLAGHSRKRHPSLLACSEAFMFTQGEQLFTF